MLVNSGLVVLVGLTGQGNDFLPANLGHSLRARLTYESCTPL